MGLKPIGAAAAIFNEDGQILLVKHTYGNLNWELPGGGAEAEESLTDTAIREVREETGLIVAVEGLSGIYYEPILDMHHFVFICRSTNEVQQPRPDGEEISDCQFWPLDSLPRPLSDFTSRRIFDAQGVRTSKGYQAIVTIGPRLWLA